MDVDIGGDAGSAGRGERGRSHAARPFHHRSGLWFMRFSNWIAVHAGRPVAFFGALTVVVVWALSGIAVGFDETWQLIINTGTTIVTFLMVFLIQGTQNRSEQAIQAKLDELIVATKTASNELLDLEEKDDGELKEIHERYLKLAEKSRSVLHRRGASQSPADGT
jgi:low affinity Fe/Cu permease